MEKNKDFDLKKKKEKNFPSAEMKDIDISGDRRRRDSGQWSVELCITLCELHKISIDSR